jgi:hypothetical protein
MSAASTPTRIEYKIVERPNSSALTEAVNKHLSEGWVLCGSLIVASDKTIKFIQAVTRTIQLPDR